MYRRKCAFLLVYISFWASSDDCGWLIGYYFLNILNICNWVNTHQENDFFHKNYFESK